MATKYKTRVPLDANGKPVVDIDFKGKESWGVLDTSIIVVHSNALGPKFLKKHPEIHHVEIVVPEEEEE